ncbi:cell surface glycoprotein CD200 receptor 2-like isoform X2 [Alexandromys fortis]|uniref:cell surface glycoprotein CD200 receptor 2-like isoform X2 n=1 Tax=Alexandromys fortis TaxID=100897 RepID=UPI0021525CA0|nr:cell surface glycoprotein CD200 receptor 2-like isoform X2 [Microtus fortis]
MNALERTSVLGLLISITILVPESSHSIMAGKWQESRAYQHQDPQYNHHQEPQDDPYLIPFDITTVSVQIGTKAVLHCPQTPSKKAKFIIWEIALISQPPCTISYRVENNETHKGCADERITWASTPDQSPDLQINAVALGHDGHYSCQIHTLMKNFQQEYSFHVIVPPEVTLVQGENRTAVCETIAGKPIAQIFWTPDGDCKTVTASHSNGTETVRSTCHWEHNNVSDVFCFVSYLTGSKLMSIELNQESENPDI